MIKTARFSFMWIIFLILSACAKSGGLAPGSTLINANLVSFAVTPVNTFVPKSQKIKLTATGTYDDKTTQDISSKVVWSVDDSSVSSISTSGVMSNSWTGSSGVKVINVTATLNGVSHTSKITITVATLTSLFVSPNTITVNPSTTQPVTVNANFSDGSTVDVSSSVTWSSSNSAVATASLGNVSGLALGTATLTATYSAQTATLNATVSNGAPGGVTLGTGLQGDYYDGINFNTFYGSRNDSTVDFNWGTGLNNLGQAAYFSVRWSGQVRAQKSETYTFYTQTDDGVRLYVDGVKVIDNWTNHATTENTSTTTFNWTADSMHTIVVEYYENYGFAVVQLKWSSATTTKAVVPQQFLYLP
jgi:hypothetical protein